MKIIFNTIISTVSFYLFFFVLEKFYNSTWEFWFVFPTTVIICLIIILLNMILWSLIK